MPVDVLLVEGKLDAEILSPLFAPAVTVERGGPKGSLKPKTRERRKEKAVRACYLRDRDFDFEPPDVLSEPTVDAQERQPAAGFPAVLGWRWCRHEMENYLLEPELVEAAAGWSQANYVRALLDAAQQIRSYTAARWAVGAARGGVLRVWELPTRPADLVNEIEVPVDCSEAACFKWAREHVQKFLTTIQRSLDPSALDASLSTRATQLADLSGANEILLWYSGKDLLAALAPALPAPWKNHPRVFIRKIQDWIRANRQDALNLFPEWQALHAALRSV